MKIGIDLDNVLNDLNQKWLLSYSLDHNHMITVEDIHCWDIHKYVKIGKEIYSYLSDELFYILNPLSYSIEVTERLSKEHELFIVTATSPKNMKVKFEWLEKYFSHIKQKNIITAYRKDLINVDLLIDDAPHNIINFPNDTIVMDYAWNRKLDNNYKRAKDWLEIEKIILNLT